MTTSKGYDELMPIARRVDESCLECGDDTDERSHHVVCLVELFETITVVFIQHRDPTPEPVSTPCLTSFDKHRIRSGIWFHLYPTVTIGFAVEVLEAVLRGFAILAYSPFVALVAHLIGV